MPEGEREARGADDSAPLRDPTPPTRAAAAFARSRHRTALEGLGALSAGLTLAFAGFGAINLLKLQDHRLPVVAFNCVLFVVFLCLWIAVVRERIDSRWANRLIVAALLSAHANVLMTFSLVAEPLQNNAVAILVITAGCFVLSARWLALGLGLMLLSWAPVAWYAAASKAELMEFGLILFAASILAMAIHAARLRTHRRLRKSEERYRRLFQQSQDAVVVSTPEGRLIDINSVSTPEGRLIDINSAGLALFGYSLDEPASFDIARDAYTDPRDREALVRQLLDKGFVKDFETTMKTRTGYCLNVEFTTSAIHDEDGRVIAFLTLLRDITRRKQEQEELARHRERLEDLVRERTSMLRQETRERQRSEAERSKLEVQFHESQKLESLGVLAGGIAHDFNNLLVGILGNAGLIRRDLPPDSPHLRLLQRIEIAADRAAELANQMLAYSGKTQFVLEACDLGRLVVEMAALLETSISKKARLVLHSAEDRFTIRADLTQVRQVVMNLITNASDALPDEGGTVTVRVGRIDDETEAPAGLARDGDGAATPAVFLEVSDTGCGMDQETRARIFDPFYSTKFEGRGLGLAAVLGIVRGHQATIQVDSEPGQGSTFRIVFPACDQPVEARAPRQPGVAAWTGGSGTVLLVDDEESVRFVARDCLEKAGFDVLTADNGHRAVELFRRHLGAIVLVLLDSRMPNLSGVETYRELRRIEPRVKVILCSGDSEPQATAGEAGLAGFLRKPFRLPDLIAKVREVVEPTARS